MLGSGGRGVERRRSQAANLDYADTACAVPAGLIAEVRKNT
jgi:hypothetical protein